MRVWAGARGLAAAAVTAIALVAFPASASAFSWEAPEAISDVNDDDRVPGISTAQPAMNAAGVMQVAWHANTLDPSNLNQVRSNRRAATGAWEQTKLIGSTEAGWGNLSYGLATLRVEPDGDGVALLGGKDGLYASVLKLGESTWSHPELAFPDPGPGVQMAGDGDGHVVSFYGSGLSLHRVDWDSDTPLSPWTDTTVGAGISQGMQPLALDMNDAGAGVLVASADYELYAFTKSAGGSWSGPVKLEGLPANANAAVRGADVDTSGNAHVLVESCQSEKCAWEAKKTAGGPWTNLTEIPHIATTSPYYGFNQFDVHFGPDGKAVIAVFTSTLKLAIMRYSGGASGTWSAPVTVPTGPNHVEYEHQSAVAPDGTVHVAYMTYDDGFSKPYDVWATRLAPGATTFGTPQKIDTLIKQNYTMRLADMMVDADGEAAVVYQNADQLRSSRGGDFPKAEVTPSSLDFGALAVNASSQKTVTLKNAGDAPLHVTEVKLEGDSNFTTPDGTGACVGTLAVNATCQVKVTFSPNNFSARSGKLVFVHDAKGNPTEVPLSGSGPAPVPQTNVDELHFGTREVGTVFPDEEFQGLEARLTNVGDGPVTISGVTVPSPYEATNPAGCDRVKLDKNVACSIFVRFRPDEAGLTERNLVFATDHGNFTIKLVGTGVQGSGIPVLPISAFEFDDTVVNGRSGEGIATLQNVGNGPLTLTGISKPVHFTVKGLGACAGGKGTLGPHKDCDVEVRFTPKSVGQKEETLRFTTDHGVVDTTIRGRATPFVPKTIATLDALNSAKFTPGKIPASKVAAKGINQTVTTTTVNTQTTVQGNGLLGQAGTNLLGQAGTNLIGQAGTNLIGQAGTNLIGQAGTNKILVRKAAKTSAKAKCPKKVLSKAPKAKCKRVVLLQGSLFLPIPGKANMTVKPTAEGKKLLKKAMAFAKAQREKKKQGKKAKKVKPLTFSYAVLVRPGGPTKPGYYTVKKLVVKP